MPSTFRAPVTIPWLRSDRLFFPFILRVSSTFRHGRYDSTERHCKNCPGYKEINTADNLYPIELTKAEFKAVQDHRKRAHPEQQVYPLLLQNAVSKVIKMVLEDQPLGTMYTSTGFSADAGQHPSMSRGGGSGYGHYLPGFQYDY